MAKGYVKLICEDCGSEIEIKKICRNRSEADNWEEWTRNHSKGTLCKSCYKAMLEKQMDNKFALCGIEFPTLLGTPKQLEYCIGFRKKTVSELLDNMNKLKKIIFSKLSEEDAKCDDEIVKFAKAFSKIEKENYNYNSIIVKIPDECIEFKDIYIKAINYFLQTDKAIAARNWFDFKDKDINKFGANILMEYFKD